MAGAVNNPVAILAYQCGEAARKVVDRCQLLLDKGRLVPTETDRRLDFHFNALLDVLAQWKHSGQPDVSLAEKFKELHQEFEEETHLKFTEEEEQILQFHLSSLEYVGGCSLHKLSALHWDQNEALPQFGDPHLLLPSGYGVLFDRLKQGLDVVHGAKVTDVDYSGSQTVVKTASGDTYTADKVLLTVPLAVLQAEQMSFEPELPEAKVKAIASLGVGKVEKVILQFNENFWRKKTKGDDFFGHVPSSEATRGLFNLFYTVTCRPNEASRKETHLLVTHIVGQALDLVKDKTESEVKDMCLHTLRAIFPGKVPDPVSWAVTSWHRDADIQMTHTYLPVGVSGATMDVLADTVADKVYFAGEATCRQFPQSVAGAYISGTREAAKIIDDVSTWLADQSLGSETTETAADVKMAVSDVKKERTEATNKANHKVETVNSTETVVKTEKMDSDQRMDVQENGTDSTSVSNATDCAESESKDNSVSDGNDTRGENTDTHVVKQEANDESENGESTAVVASTLTDSKNAATNGSKTIEQNVDTDKSADQDVVLAKKEKSADDIVEGGCVKMDVESESVS
ncbi:hypothetical protein V1264_009717 [Littorina saxatilis]|uniref:Amine oxidase domain-containing protein n=2 Tax=Littorina saxatilis TaxID=31220 RepID=A0AAN9G2B4_9CAEN